MDSIHGPVSAPRMMPPVQPRHAPDPDVSGSNGGQATPAAPPIPTDRGPTGPIGDIAEPGSLGAPPGVDPEFWSVLTAEEREFFSVARQMGPVTYGPQPSDANEASLPRGRRLDVRI